MARTAQQDAISAAMRAHWKRRRAQPERKLQAAVAEFLGWAAPPGMWWGAIPGGDRGVTLTPGYVAGSPDLLIVYRGRAIALELKSRTGQQQPAQRAVQMAWTLAGGLYHVVRDVTEVEAFLRMLGVPLRGRVAA